MPDDLFAPLTNAGDEAGELLVLRLEVDGETLDEGLVAHLTPNAVLLPLGALSDLFELPLEVEPAFGRAEGWLMDPRRPFALDTAAGTVRHGTAVSVLQLGTAIARKGEIFVSADLIEGWLPILITVDLPRLVLTVTTREQLPFQRRLAREAERRRLGESGAVHDDLPKRSIPYRLASIPSVDISAELGQTRSPSTGGVAEARQSTFISSDLLGLSADAFLLGDRRDPFSDLRFRIGRRDPDGDLLGPLQATEFVAGDIVTPGTVLLRRPRAERGVLISNFGLNQVTALTDATVSGELPIGWEVELYRDGALLDFQVDVGTGLFLFEDVPLAPGLNVFRLVFYGPQGQRREETRRVFAGPGLLPRGDFRYRFSASQAETDLLSLREPELRAGVTGAPRYLLESEYGLSRRWALSATAASLPLPDGRHNYSGIGLRTDLGRAFTAVDIATDISGGYAVRGLAQARIFGTALTVEHARLSEFESEREVRSGDPLAHRSRLRIDRLLPLAGKPVLTSLTLNHEAVESGKGRSEANLRLSTALGQVIATNTLRLRIADEDSREVEGSFLISGRRRPFLLRGAIDYGAAPALAARGVSASVQWRVQPDLVTELGLDRRLDTKTAGAFLTVSKMFERFAVGLGFRGESDGSYRAGLSLSVGFGFDPRRSRWIAEPHSIASHGTLSARVFLDADGDRSFSAGDRPLAGAVVAVPGSGHQVTTDEHGLAFLTRLPANRATRVILKPESLEDPFMRPVVPGVWITPRPGATAMVDFPVILTGEIDGTVWLERGEVLDEQRGVDIDLVDAAGQILRTISTAFDGFYLFEEVPPGKYLVRVAPQTADRLDVRLPEPRRVTISADGDVASGINFTLERVSADPASKEPSRGIPPQ